MAFLAPLAGLLAALAIPIILLYMLRLRRREIEVSSTYLWTQLLQDREANAPWQRLRRNLLLILQLIILAALVFALMRPFIETPVITTGRITVLLDASVSMNATDIEPSRFVAAQQAALDIATTLGAGDTMTVIRVAETPEVLANATNDPTLLQNAIQSAQPSQGAANWSAALTLAAGGGAGVENYSVVVIGDGGLPLDVPNIQAEVRYVPVGESGENVAITALATRARAGEGPQLFANVQNYGDFDAEVIFTIYLDGELDQAARHVIPAGGSQGVTVTDLPEDFTVLRATLTTTAGSGVPDYLPSDDVAWTVYNPRGAGTALLMTPGNLYLRQMLASLPGINASQARIENGLPENTPFDLYIFDGWLPAPLPDGDLLIIDPPQDTPLFTLVGRSEQTFTGNVTPRVAEDDPRALYVNFDNVHILDFKVLYGIEWADPLIWVEDGPLVLAGEVDGRQVAILTFDLHRSDLPLQLAWPILMSNLMGWYTPARAVNAPDGLSVGETLVIAPPFEANTIRVHQPDGSVTTFAEGDLAAQVIFADTAQPGVYTVETYSGEDLIQSEPFTVNLFERLESDIRPAEALTIGTATVGEAEREEIGQVEFWPWIVLLALAVLGLEWTVYHRGRRLPQATGHWSARR